MLVCVSICVDGWFAFPVPFAAVCYALDLSRTVSRNCFLCLVFQQGRDEVCPARKGEDAPESFMSVQGIRAVRTSTSRYAHDVTCVCSQLWAVTRYATFLPLVCKAQPPGYDTYDTTTQGGEHVNLATATGLLT